MKEEEHIPTERIEAYLNGTMAEADRNAFEAELASHPSWQEALHIQQELHLVPEIENLQQAIVQAEEKYFVKEDRPNRSVKLWPVLLAASVIGLMLLGWWLSRNPETPLPKDFLQPYPSYSQLRTDDSDTTDLWTYYNRGDFSIALDSLQKREGFESNPRYQFYAGNCALMLRKTDAAIVFFLSLTSSTEEHAFREQSYWFLGLAYWQKGETDKARKAFLVIENSKAYGQRVKEILPAL